MPWKRAQKLTFDYEQKNRATNPARLIALHIIPPDFLFYFAGIAQQLADAISEFGVPDLTWDLAWLTAAFAYIEGGIHDSTFNACARSSQEPQRKKETIRLPRRSNR